MLYRSHLQTFLALYRTGSQSRAAELLFMTQPAVSQQMKTLEARVGRPLFIRQGKYLQPTEIAHQLAFAINPHIEALDWVWNNFNASTKSTSGIVYFGGIAEFFGTVIAPHLTSLYEQGIQLCFEIGHDILLEKLLNNELDLAQFCAHIVHPEIEIEKLYQHHFLLVGHASWTKKINKKAIKSGDISCLDKIPWIAYDQSLLFIKEYFQTVFDKDFAGNVSLMIKDLWSIAETVAGGAGITVLPSYFCQKYFEQGKLKLLYEPETPPIHQFYLGWKKGALRNQRIAIVKKLLKDIVKRTTFNTQALNKITRKTF